MPVCIYCRPIGMHNSPKQDHQWEVGISNFKTAVWESRDSAVMTAIFANQISTRYLNPRLHIYFPFCSPYSVASQGGGDCPGLTSFRGVTPEWKKLWAEFTKNSGETRSERWKRSGVTPSRGWHPSEINEIDSDEQKGGQFFSGKK